MYFGGIIRVSYFIMDREMLMPELFIFSEIGFIQHLKSALADMVSSIKDIATDINIAEAVVLVAAMLFALTAGVFGYRLLKFICAVGFAGVGYVVGSAIFDFLLLQEGMENLPAILTYVFGGVLALLFFFLGFKKFTYVLFAVAYLVGYNFFWGFFGDDTVAMGAGLILAVLSVLIVRVMVILLTSFAGSLTAISMVGALLPETAMVQIGGENDFALIVALGLGVIFALVQFLFARFYKAE